ncbi:MAG: hypothetical protein AAGF12_26440 [Myxococcota bacterium]
MSDVRKRRRRTEPMDFGVRRNNWRSGSMDSVARCIARWFTPWILAAGCQSSAPLEHRAELPRPPAVVEPLPEASPGRLGRIEAEVRTLGPIEASAGVDEGRPSAFEPILYELDIDNRSEEPLRFDVGGDYRGLLFHLRYNVEVRVEGADAPACSLGTERPPHFGGLGTMVELAPAGRFHDVQALNPSCEVLEAPGRYRIRVVRALTDSERPADSTLPCGGRCPECDDLTPEDATDPDAEGRCAEWLRSFPVVAAEFPLRVGSYEPALLRTRLSTLGQALRTVSSAAPERGAIAFYGQWLCRALICDCPEYRDDAEFFDELAALVPEAPEPCDPADNSRN